MTWAKCCAEYAMRWVRRARAARARRSSSEAMLKAEHNFFNYGRQTSESVMLILTDGHMADTRQQAFIADKLKAQGVRIMAVPIGSDAAATYGGSGGGSGSGSGSTKSAGGTYQPDPEDFMDPDRMLDLSASQDRAEQVVVEQKDRGVAFVQKKMQFPVGAPLRSIASQPQQNTIIPIPSFEALVSRGSTSESHDRIVVATCPNVAMVMG